MNRFPLFSDLLARIRGGEDWPQTRATVFSREPVLGAGSRQSSRIVFTYRVAGEIQQGQFCVTNAEPDLNKDDSFDIHYDPAWPSRHYYPPAAKGAAFVLKLILAWAIILVVVLSFTFLKNRQ